jgi:hypothetical protein
MRVTQNTFIPNARSLHAVVMCACHRTSPTAILWPAIDSTPETDAEQRGLHAPKRMTFLAGRQHQRRDRRRFDSTLRHATLERNLPRLEPAPWYVRRAVTPRQTKTLPSAPKAVTFWICSATTALAAGQKIRTLPRR